jgi:tungstate transport system ATP-binding protein
MSDRVLEARGVQVRYGERLVVDVPDLGVRRADTLAIIGPNGAGKSTLLRVFGLLERPTVGEILLDGRSIEWNLDLLATRRRFASVFQEPFLIEGAVGQNVALGLELRRRPRGEVRQRTEGWMRRFGIAHLTSRQARTLSGGEAQRVSLARAFAIEPEILLLDEPFAALDPQTRDSVLHDLQQVLRDRRPTTVFVTHDRDEAFRLGDQVAVMLDGRLEQVGAPAEIFSRPISRAVARFVGAENILAGRVVSAHEGVLTVDTGRVCVRAAGHIPVGDSVLVCLRPEDLAVAPATGAPPHDGVLNRLPGRVTRLLLTGLQYRLEVDCGLPLVAIVTRQSAEALQLGPASQVIVSFKASAVHVLMR